MGKKRGPTKNTDKPHGQLGLFLTARLERDGLSPSEFGTRLKAAGLEKDNGTIRKWLSGSNGPRVSELGHIAKALGYKTWLDMLADLPGYLPKKSKK